MAYYLIERNSVEAREKIQTLCFFQWTPNLLRSTSNNRGNFPWFWFSRFSDRIRISIWTRQFPPSTIEEFERFPSFSVRTQPFTISATSQVALFNNLHRCRISQIDCELDIFFAEISHVLTRQPRSDHCVVLSIVIVILGHFFLGPFGALKIFFISSLFFVFANHHTGHC